MRKPRKKIVYIVETFDGHEAGTEIEVFATEQSAINFLLSKGYKPTSNGLYYNSTAGYPLAGIEEYEVKP